MSPGSPAPPPLVHTFDDYGLEAFLEVAAHFGQSRFGFVVTPNVDHLIRCHDDPLFRSCYARADFVLLDSRFAARLLRLLKRQRLPVCPGSDLTAALLGRIIRPGDRIVLIGADESQVAHLAATYPLTDLHHHNPPMGFIQDAAAVERCLSVVERASPFRFCFLAVGSPQQELLAARLGQRGVARGLALCVGASLNFLTGRERRAPRWLQRLSLEWLYRLAHDPRRLSRRYLVRGPRIFTLLRQTPVLLRGRPRAAAPAGRSAANGPDHAGVTRAPRA